MTETTKGLPAGRHLCLDFFECSADLDDVSALVQVCQLAAAAAGAHVLGIQQHQFSPQGVSVVVMLAESHLSLHTWPETGAAAADIYTCGAGMDPQSAGDLLLTHLQPRSMQVQELTRGRRPELSPTSPQVTVPADPGANTWVVEARLPHGRPGIKVSYEVTRILADEHTRYGHLQVLETPFFGRALLIDGIVQVTQSDEHIYHEMLVTLPLVRHGGVRSVAIAGGGDGGSLRQALRSTAVRTAVQVDIDPRVGELCREFLPDVGGNAHRDPRATLVHDDAYEYFATTTQAFDLIALDLTDPVPDGPAHRLFETPFYELALQRLNPGGLLMIQCGSLLLQPNEVAECQANLRALTDHVQLHSAVVPSYQQSLFGFALASRDQLPELTPTDCDTRLHELTGPTRYLNAATYQASLAAEAQLAAWP